MIPVIRLTSCLQSRLVAALMLTLLLGISDAHGQSVQKDTRAPVTPDLRGADIDLKLQRGDFVAVPIPISNPTFGSGLIAGAAYFYPQTEQQRAVQPASLTAAAGAYTDSDSKALALVQQNYWNNNNWRFTGAIAAADLRLSLLAPDDTAGKPSLDWRVKGYAFLGRLSAQVWPNWYAGLHARFADVDQSIETDLIERSGALSILPGIRSAGLGTYVEFDTRDMPTNAYKGRYFKFDALFNSEFLGSNKTYQNYDLLFNSYHQLGAPLVLAWQVRACLRSDNTPLWDSCAIKLRGFPVTDYLGTGSASTQLEARWKMSRRWGLIGFAGTGYSRGRYAERRDREWIPSYGAGIRFMVLESKRINLRVDYARSKDSDSIHILVGEAF